MAGVQDNEDLENILQCPVCYEIPKSDPVRQCDRGHHICEPCFHKMRNYKCPICKASYYGTRNFIAEDLIKIFPSLRIEPPSAAVPSIQTNEAKVQVKSAPLLCRGHFPCLFPSCNKTFGAGRILQHIRDHHRQFLIEVSAQNKYTEKWDLRFMKYGICVEAIRIANMGLFFLVVNMDQKGLLQAAVQMVASEEVATMFKFKIKILGVEGETKMSFKNRVFSCHDTLNHLADNGQCLEIDTKKFLQRSNSRVFSLSIIDGRQ